jgi:hypothetical protein
MSVGTFSRKLASEVKRTLGSARPSRLSSSLPLRSNSSFGRWQGEGVDLSMVELGAADRLLRRKLFEAGGAQAAVGAVLTLLAQPGGDRGNSVRTISSAAMTIRRRARRKHNRISPTSGASSSTASKRPHRRRSHHPAVGNNKLRHETLQRFMLANDSVTVAIEIPIWLTETDIAGLERQQGETAWFPFFFNRAAISPSE